MNVPLTWLSEYVSLPKDTKVLTDKLTSVGHMLDKTTKVGNETVIDLELRGNRADMFGLWGVAREVAAVLKTKLKLPQTSPLPKIDKNSPLVNIQPSAVDLVYRYTAVKLTVKVGPSPKWMVDRLNAYGIPSVNNVVDVTNYVMVESSHPLHAFDYSKVKGEQLILRRARDGEKFATVQQGTTLTLTKDDLVIADLAQVQCLSIIGGFDSRVTEGTTQIILESAVYNPANSRRTARRLKTMTEGGNRHEKHQDPYGVGVALARAVDLLTELAQAKVEGDVSDYYPKLNKTKTINFDIREVTRLIGLVIPRSEIIKILQSLGFQVRGQDVVVPTFRTDIEGTADLVEEVIRIYGYDQIPVLPISDATPVPNNYPTYSIQERLRNLCTQVGLDEVVTLTTVESGEVKLVNPPDPTLSYLRTNIAPQLVKYAQKQLNLRRTKAGLFEVGKTFTKNQEHLQLGLAMGGKEVTISNLTGVLQTLAKLLGIDELPVTVGETEHIFWAEVDVDSLMTELPKIVNPYSVVSTYPPIIEDVNITYSGNYKDLVTKIKKLSDLITNVELVDNYDNKLTLRITYHSNSRQLSSEDVQPLREKLGASIV